MHRMISLLLIMLVLAACGNQATTVDAPIAPTTVPLASNMTAVPVATNTITAQATPTIAPTTQTAARPAPNAPTQVVAPKGMINLPEGFGISVFATNLKAPRMMTLGSDGAIYVAERAAGRIVRLPDRNADGVSDGVEVIADGLDAPSSMAFFKDNSLYVGETTRILRLSNPDANGKFSQKDTIIADLPDGGHNTRTVLFSRDWTKLYVSIGSSCNVCNESDKRRAAIMIYNPDGTDGKLYAKGLRNAVGIAWRPNSDELWATNNGRDMLGDDQPPENVYTVTQAGQDFGWPRCHSGRIPDPEFGTNADACTNVVSPAVEMQAHSAPLGLTFAQNTNFPAPYNNGLFVAFHGSWNRSIPTGYKVVFIPMTDGKAGTAQDFATGWLQDTGGAWGRPVDVLFGSDGSLYVSDDAGGTIYRIFAR